MALVQTKDMTAGNPVKLILIFALPILAGNMLQQLYSLVDSLIIGRLLGVTARGTVLRRETIRGSEKKCSSKLPYLHCGDDLPGVLQSVSAASCSGVDEFS